MGRIVQKFGGTALPTIDSIRKAAEIAIKAAEEGNEVTAVVSSIGKTTDQLRSVAESLAQTPNARDLDMLLSTAEQASVALLSMAIQSLGWPARAFTAPQAGIVTESRHGSAPIREICCDEIEHSLDRGEIAVISGFQGITETLEITTVGDGGADTAAIALACSLEADRCDVFTDVDGICTADQAIVSDARVLPALSYEEMFELSVSGMPHLCPEAVQLAMDNFVTIRVRPINNYENLGTIITRKYSSENGLCAVVLDEEQASMCVKVYTPGGTEKPLEGFGSLFARLDELSIPLGLVMLMTREDEPAQELTFTVDKGQVAKVRSIIESLSTTIDHPIVRVDPQISMMTIVGQALHSGPEVISEVFDTLNRAAIPIHMVSTSNLKLSLVLPAVHARHAVRLVHKRLELPFKTAE
jgi:aspartate kinase